MAEAPSEAKKQWPSALSVNAASHAAIDEADPAFRSGKNVAGVRIRVEKTVFQTLAKDGLRTLFNDPTALL